MVSDALQRPPPQFLGRYEILLPIASGGMATVYLARTRGVGGFERDVAIKVTHQHLAQHPEFVADLIEEAKLTVRIRHPNVVTVLDAGEDAQGVFLAMEYVEGDSLSGLWRKTARQLGTELPLPIALRILCDSLAGLHAAHELKDEDGSPAMLVHRDFSPQNVLIGTDGTARLTDFGIAKAASRLSHTHSGSVKGKVSYMAPEQIKSRPLDRRCDVWAAGVIAWELLSGRRLYPVDGEEYGVLFSIVSEPVPRLRDSAPRVPFPLDEVVAAALDQNVATRLPSALAFRSALIDASKRSGVEIADHADVGALVERVAGASLAERRQRAKEIIALRRRMGSLASGDPSTRSSADLGFSQGTPSAPGSRPSAPVLPTAAAPALDFADGRTMPMVGRGPEITRTDTSSVGELARLERRREGPPLRTIAIATGAGTVVAGVALLLTFGRGPKPAPSHVAGSEGAGAPEMEQRSESVSASTAARSPSVSAVVSVAPEEEVVLPSDPTIESAAASEAPASSSSASVAAKSSAPRPATAPRILRGASQNPYKKGPKP